MKVIGIVDFGISNWQFWKFMVKVLFDVLVPLLWNKRVLLIDDTCWINIVGEDPDVLSITMFPAQLTNEPAVNETVTWSFLIKRIGMNELELIDTGYIFVLILAVWLNVAGNLAIGTAGTEHMLEIS